MRGSRDSKRSSVLRFANESALGALLYRDTVIHVRAGRSGQPLREIVGLARLWVTDFEQVIDGNGKERSKGKSRRDNARTIAAH